MVSASYLSFDNPIAIRRRNNRQCSITANANSSKRRNRSFICSSRIIFCSSYFMFIVSSAWNYLTPSCELRCSFRIDSKLNISYNFIIKATKTFIQYDFFRKRSTYFLAISLLKIYQIRTYLLINCIFTLTCKVICL